MGSDRTVPQDMLSPGRTLARLALTWLCWWAVTRCAAAQPAFGQFRPPSAPLATAHPCYARSLFWHQSDCYHPNCCTSGCCKCSARTPAWYAAAEFIPLYRDQNGTLDAQPLVPGGTLRLGTGDLDSEFEEGGRFVIGRSIGDCYRLELAWLGDYKRSDTDAIRTDNEFASIGFDSRLISGELNLRNRVCLFRDAPDYGVPMALSTLLGVRYMSNDEHMQYAAQANANSSLADVAIENDMFGLQIGALWQFLIYCCAWIDIEVKGGVLSNDMDVASVYSVTPGGASQYAGNEIRTAYLADVSVMLNYQFAPAWTMHIGYTALWLGGQAQGSMNLSPDPTLPLADIDHSGEMIYHGPALGLVFAY